MAAEMLLINPRRRKARKTSTKRRAKRARVVTRAANPIRRRRARRHNPIGSVRRRVMTASRRTRGRSRRRNPISLGGSSQWIAMVKEAAIGGAGSVAMDLLMGKLNEYLPDSMKRTPGTLGVGDAVKVGLTIAVGMALNKATRGLSKKAAMGALIVQAAEMIRTFVPDTMTMGNPAMLTRGGRSLRVGPNSNRLAQFIPGQSPMLNGLGQYIPGSTPMLNGTHQDVRVRESPNFIR